MSRSNENLKNQDQFESSVMMTPNLLNSANTFLSLNPVFDQELVRFYPFGLQLSVDGMNPVLLLRDEKGELTLPVLLNQLEAGVALTQANKTIAPVTPHKVTQVLLETLNLKIESCHFMDVKSPHLYVRLNLSGHSDVKFINVRADEAMSFCLHMNVPMFATRAFVNQAKVLNAEAQGLLQGIKLNPEVLAKNHKYVM